MNRGRRISDPCDSYDFCHVNQVPYTCHRIVDVLEPLPCPLFVLSLFDGCTFTLNSLRMSISNRVGEPQQVPHIQKTKSRSRHLWAAFRSTFSTSPPTTSYTQASPNRNTESWGNGSDVCHKSFSPLVQLHDFLTQIVSSGTASTLFNSTPPFTYLKNINPPRSPPHAVCPSVQSFPRLYCLY